MPFLITKRGIYRERFEVIERMGKNFLRLGRNWGIDLSWED